jgi:hypothetical protein
MSFYYAAANSTSTYDENLFLTKYNYTTSNDINPVDLSFHYPTMYTNYVYNSGSTNLLNISLPFTGISWPSNNLFIQKFIFSSYFVDGDDYYYCSFLYTVKPYVLIDSSVPYYQAENLFITKLIVPTGLYWEVNGSDFAPNNIITVYPTSPGGTEVGLILRTNNFGTIPKGNVFWSFQILN